MSSFGRWEQADGLPVFVYTADTRQEPARPHDGAPDGYREPRHWNLVGNRRIQLACFNSGDVGLYDEADGSRWITAPFPEGTGTSTLTMPDGTRWGTGIADWPEHAPIRTFGPTFFQVTGSSGGVTLEKTILCPDGELPWVVARARLTSDRRVAVTHTERWAVRPQFLTPALDIRERAQLAAEQIDYRTIVGAHSIRAIEQRRAGASPRESRDLGPLGTLTDVRSVFGAPADVFLETDPGHAATLTFSVGEDGWPELLIDTVVDLSPGQTQELWFRFGRDDGSAFGDPAALLSESLAALAECLPRVEGVRVAEIEHEIGWHAAMLTGASCVDEVLGGSTLSEASVYSFLMGLNLAARDPLQFALPLVYIDPELALRVLRNTCAWATPDGDLAFALDGAKNPVTTMLQPSDANLFAFWLAAEYAAATGDRAAFDEPLALHPMYRAEAVTLKENLVQQFRFFRDVIGRGHIRGHVRMRNADWNDLAIEESGVERATMIEQGESVLNSAMASWVLPVFAGLLDRLGEPALADEARTLAGALRDLVTASWNGHWFDRAYGPNGEIVGGPSEMWLEPQPWALIGGAAGAVGAQLTRAIVNGPAHDSPLGARVRWPVPTSEAPGESLSGGIWFSINATLVWALRDQDPELAWGEWRKMTLASHTASFPDVWEGTLSGPDAFNAPESSRPGRTWASSLVGDGGSQTFPVSNPHSHAQPLLALLRLLGVEPTESGALRVKGGAAWRSPTFMLNEDGHGHLLTKGEVTVETPFGTVTGGPGLVRW